jgi:hypothetical protein
VTARAQLKMGLAVCCFIAAAGCAQNDETISASKEPVVAVSGIAVMPVRSAVDFEEAVSLVDEKSLKDGVQVMDSLLKQVLAGKPGVRFVVQQSEAGGSERRVNNLEAARRIAAQQGCNAILETTLSRFNERVGGDFGVKQPAAVTFAYKLYEVGDGRVLCHGRFDEQQQPVMENLLALSRAKTRGFTWLTAEELARAGLQERLGQCSYIESK